MNSTAPTITTTPVQMNHIRNCARCASPYDWRRSTSSSLKMTYCGSLCEKGDLGFTIETLLEASKFRTEIERPVDRPVTEIFPLWGKELMAA
ncbi:MAG: hypothetical protein WED87_03195 [Dehalococcoidia bacterium]